MATFRLLWGKVFASKSHSCQLPQLLQFKKILLWFACEIWRQPGEGKAVWHYALHGAAPRFLQSRVVLPGMALLVSLKPEHVFPRCRCWKASSEVSGNRLHYLSRFERSMGSELLNEGTFAEKWCQWIEWTVGAETCSSLWTVVPELSSTFIPFWLLLPFTELLLRGAALRWLLV